MSDDDQQLPSAVEQVGALDSQQTAPASHDELDRGDAVASYIKDKDRGISVRLRSPFRTYFDGKALSLSAQNATGPFDVLPGHHNFICLLEPCDVIVRTTKKGEQKFTIGGGMMHVKADQIVVFLDI